MMKDRLKAEPIPVVRQLRPIRVRDFTTAKPGKIQPIMAVGLLRGDSCSGRLSVGIDMSETYEVLFNRMHARINVWFIPKVALDRFKGNKTYFERSAVGEPVTDDVGAPVIPYIATMVYATPANPIFKSLGLAAKSGAVVSSEYIEAYNHAVNDYYRMRSKSLTARLLTDTSLAAAMWGPNSMSEIVPDFDSGMIAGETPLTVVSGDLPVTSDSGFVSVKATSDGIVRNLRGKAGTSDIQANGAVFPAGTSNLEFSNVYAQLSDNGITVSLANIDQARKLVEFAKMREAYEAHDPWIIDTLMSGIPLDDQKWFRPMLIDSQMVDIKQLKRMATDGENLEEGVANGVAQLTVGVNVPQNPFGGTILITAECIPEQLYERQADPYFTTTNRDELPRYDRDVMNPMPVVEVKNKQVDVMHSVPEGRFGYARRNWQWANNPTRVGGDFFAPNADAQTAIERRSIYPTEVADPALNSEFYLTGTLGRQVFVDQVKDPFRIGIGGTLDVIGLTVIGEVHESEANFDAVRAEYAPLQP